MTWFAGVVALLLALAAPAHAAVLHVDDGAAPGGDGSAASPYRSLQVAIDAAAGGDEIRVADGTYGPISVSDKAVQLLGGYSADFTVRGAATPSLLQGTPAGPTVSLFNAGSTVLDGFTIRGGQRGVLIDADFDSTTNRPQVRFNLIEQNDTANIEGLNGGGVAAFHCDAALIGNTIRGNRARRGAGVSVECNSILIENNLIENNVGYEDHGGGLNLAGPNLVVRGNLIRNNEIGFIIGFGWGGGAIAFNQGTSVSFERNVFTGNRAMSLGSGVFVDDGAVATFDHDLFYANQCGGVGGAAIYVHGFDIDVASRVRLVHVTIAAHHCPGQPGNAVYIEPPLGPSAQLTVEILNSIIWDNGGDDFEPNDPAVIRATYTLSQEPIAGTGNLSADPLFANPAGGDFHVRSTRGRFDPASGTFVVDAVDSPSIDAGDPGSDFSLEPAPNGLRVNLGHTGNTAQAGLSPPGGTPPVALPALALAVNASAFRAGQALILTATLSPGSPGSPGTPGTPGAAPMLVDAYVVIRLPDGSFFSLLLDGRIVPGIVPIATGLTPFQVTQQLLGYTFNGGEPAGTYTWMAALTRAGTGTVIGRVQEVPFTFSP